MATNKGLEKKFLLIVGIAIIIITITKPNFGFLPFSNPNAIGYNLWSLIVYIVGGFIIYRYFRDRSNNKVN